MGPKRFAFPCLIALASAVGSVGHAASVNYDGVFIDNLGAPFLYSLDGSLTPNWRSGFGVFDIDKLFQRSSSRPFLFQNPLSRSLQLPDFNMGNFMNSNSLPGIRDSSNTGLASGNASTGLFWANNQFTSVFSGNVTGNSPAVTSSNSVAMNSASPQQISTQNTSGLHETINTGLASGTPASSVKPSSTLKGSDSSAAISFAAATGSSPSDPKDASMPTIAVVGASSLSFPLMLLDPIAPANGSVASSSSPSGSVSAAPLPNTLSLFASGLVGLALLMWLRKRKAKRIHSSV